MIVYDKTFATVQGFGQARRPARRSRKSLGAINTAAQIRAAGLASCKASCHADFAGALEAAKTKYVVARSQHDITQRLRSGVTKYQGFGGLQGFAGPPDVNMNSTVSVDRYGATWVHQAGWWEWRIPSYGVQCPWDKSIDECYNKNLNNVRGVIDQHHAAEAEIFRREEAARVAAEQAAAAAAAARAAGIPAPPPPPPILTSKDILFQKWWFANGVDCGGVGNTVAYSQQDCQRRLEWCWTNHRDRFASCFGKCGAVNAQPWTEEGGGCRQLPLLPGQNTTLFRDAASVTKDIENTLKPPELSELDPEVLAIMFFQNPLRYAAITTWAGIMYSTGAIIPWMLAKMVGQSADVKQAIEATLVFLITPQVPVLVALGVKQSLRRGGWDRAWANILGPLVELGGDALQVAVAYISGGPTAAAAAGVNFVAKRLKGVPPIIIVCLRAAAQVFGSILGIIEKPETIKDAAIWSAIGSAIDSIGAQVTDAAAEVVAVIRGMGQALMLYAQTISFLLKGKFAEAQSEVLMCTFGFDLQMFKDMTASDRQRLAKPNLGAIEMLKSVDGVVAAFTKSLENVVKFLQINPLINMLGSLSADIKNFFASVFGFVASVIPQAGPPPPTPEQLAAILRDKDATINALQQRVAEAEAARQKESQVRLAAESALAAKSQEASVLAQKFATADAAAQAGSTRAATLEAQSTQKAESEKAKATGGGTGLAIAAAAAAAAFLT